MEEYSVNPYQNYTDSLTNIPVTPLMIDHLRATKPGVRFVWIVSFILAALMVVAGLAMILLSTATPAMAGFGFGPIVGVIYILFAGLYIAPAYFLHQFASSIGNLMQGGGDVALEAALGSQKPILAVRRHYDACHYVYLRTDDRRRHLDSLCHDAVGLKVETRVGR